MRAVNYEQALNRMATYCSRSEKCTQDVRKKLDLWEIPPQEQTRIVQSLQKEKFLDEDRYASAFVRDKARFNGWGIHRIRLELKKRNLPAEVINNALLQLNPEETLTRLTDLLTKKSKSITAKTEWEAKQKLMRFALSRGFSLEETEKAMREL